MLGIYEITLNRIAYDTSIPAKDIETILKSFEGLGKAFYWYGNVFLPNWVKNQSMNPNMVKSAVSEFGQLSNELKDKLKENGVESFESLSKGLVILSNIEVEDEEEREDESNENFESFWDLYSDITGLKKTDRESAEKHWKKLGSDEKQKAIDNIKPYFDSLNDKKFCKKARTYLADKNFNDEFELNKNNYDIKTIFAGVRADDNR